MEKRAAFEKVFECQRERGALFSGKVEVTPGVFVDRHMRLDEADSEEGTIEGSSTTRSKHVEKITLSATQPSRKNDGSRAAIFRGGNRGKYRGSPNRGRNRGVRSEASVSNYDAAKTKGGSFSRKGPPINNDIDS